MARSISGAKLISAAVTKAITGGRGFSAAAATAGNAAAGKGGSSSVTAATSGMVKKTGEASKSSWVPDPRTGFYRPENVAEEIDAAQLRALLLRKH
ncbi:unnamed protein product [Linum tenue]|uniref:Uncharacterized protein n=1 Tax=Linum tenue TaxID=586396 RepID=A0AAV0RWV7_9ROSI|nr:unnamed protein product [Linum tenue]